MNIDISNAHCGPRIQFPDHAWLRVVLVPLNCLRPKSAARPRRGRPENGARVACALCGAYNGRTSDRWTFARGVCARAVLRRPAQILASSEMTHRNNNNTEEESAQAL